MERRLKHEPPHHTNGHDVTPFHSKYIWRRWTWKEGGRKAASYRGKGGAGGRHQETWLAYILNKTNTFSLVWMTTSYTHTYSHTHTVNHSYFLVSLNFYLSSIIAIIPLHYIFSGILVSDFTLVNFFFVSLTCAWHVLRSICWTNIWITDYYTCLLTGWNSESLSKIKSHLSSRGWCQLCSYLSAHLWGM